MPDDLVNYILTTLTTVAMIAATFIVMNRIRDELAGRAAQLQRRVEDLEMERQPAPPPILGIEEAFERGRQAGIKESLEVIKGKPDRMPLPVARIVRR